MKKVALGLLLLIILISGASAYLLHISLPDETLRRAARLVGIKKLDNREGDYYVYQNGNFIRAFDNKDDALAFAEDYSNAYVTRSGDGAWVWDNYPQSSDSSRFSVYFGDKERAFASIPAAFAYARGKEGAVLVNRSNGAVMLSGDDKLPDSYIIEGVPVISQHPELPRGCEVTSLAMLLNYRGTGASKLELAERIKKDATPYSQDETGVITFGNPARGFVGDMYDKSKPGLGVYHGPIYELLKAYVGDDALDLTGADFADLYYFIAKDKPVLIITNSSFAPLGDSEFFVWNTSDGEILVTNYEHSVLITGYDESYIYFNDPLDNSGTQRAPIADFAAAWEQMGRQAVTYFE